jgi:hypothetical protein
MWCNRKTLVVWREGGFIRLEAERKKVATTQGEEKD